MRKESKQDRFIRVAEQRTQKILECLRALSNCAAHASYEYTPQQVEQIFNAIDAEAELTRSRFDGKRQFSLSSNKNKED
ncbi:MAG: hypothetical protein PHY23_00340 [Oscillospiraceae bacterium]|nr:hypothetical protein [Oscillospiraceae bacterium]